MAQGRLYMFECGRRQEFRERCQRQGTSVKPPITSSRLQLFQASIYVPAVGKVTILMLLRNLYDLIHCHYELPTDLLQRLRLTEYKNISVSKSLQYK
jgi:hypothetical protein